MPSPWITKMVREQEIEMTTEKKLRCRASTTSASSWRRRQCDHPAKGEREMLTYVTGTQTKVSLPACGLHLRERSGGYPVHAYKHSGSKYETPVQEFTR